MPPRLFAGDRCLRSVNRVLRPLGLHVEKSRPKHEINAALIRSLRRTTASEIRRRLGPCVVAGPFQGQRLADGEGWSAPDLGALLLGCYEEQLHPAIEQIVSVQPDVVVNIGCAEGYYAVGIARRCAGTHVVAVDTDERAAQHVRGNAEINGVGDRVEFRASFDLDDFNEILARASTPVAVLDCEGAEIHYVDPTRVPAMAKSMLLVELHDFIVPGVAQELRRRLERSHHVVEISESGRDPHRRPELHDLGTAERYLAVSEDRPTTMSWILATPLERAP
jgi:predicted O-methyltransferase YrrM